MTLQPPAVPVFYPGLDFTTPIVAGGASMASNMHDAFQFLLAKTTFIARRTGAGNPVKNTTTYVPWDTIDEDPYSGWSAGTPSVYTAPAPGWYSVSGTVSLSGTGAAGMVMATVFAVNGASPTGQGGFGVEGADNYPPAAAPMVDIGSWEGYCNAGDQIQLGIFYSNEPAANLAWNTTAGQQSSVVVVWMGM